MLASNFSVVAILGAQAGGPSSNLNPKYLKNYLAQMGSIMFILFLRTIQPRIELRNFDLTKIKIFHLDLNSFLTAIPGQVLIDKPSFRERNNLVVVKASWGSSTFSQLVTSLYPRLKSYNPSWNL